LGGGARGRDTIRDDPEGIECTINNRFNQSTLEPIAKTRHPA